MWALVECPQFLTIGPAHADDRVQLYLLFANGFDGTLAWSAVPTPIRVVCKNTLNVALGIDAGDAMRGERQLRQRAGIYIRHSESAEVRIEEARRVLGLTLKTFTEAGKTYQALSAAAITSAAFRRYLDAVVPVVLSSRTPAADELSEARTRQVAVHEGIARCFESGLGSDLASAKGTAWGAYNAVTEWVDHVYPVTKSGEVSVGRLRSALFGTHAEVKRRALSEATALAARGGR